jgi:hypothetical protein
MNQNESNESLGEEMKWLHDSYALLPGGAAYRVSDNGDGIYDAFFTDGRDIKGIFLRKAPKEDAISACEEHAERRNSVSELRKSTQELAREFRQAVDALRTGLLHETTCDWCGGDVQTVNDHRIVDGQPMCLSCVKEYKLEEGKDYER